MQGWRVDHIGGQLDRGCGGLHSGNPYDGHTLADSLKTIKRLTGIDPKHAYCDKGYRGHGYKGATEIHVAGCGPKNKTRFARFWSRRRSAVEPTIGHMKSDNRMARNYLKGNKGDKTNAILAAAGYNLRKLIRAFFLPALRWLWNVNFGIKSPRGTLWSTSIAT